MNEENLLADASHVIKADVSRVLVGQSEDGTDVRVELALRRIRINDNDKQVDWRQLYGRYLASLDMIQSLFRHDEDMPTALEVICDEVVRTRSAFLTMPTNDPEALLTKLEMLFEADGASPFSEMPSELTVPVIEDARRILGKPPISVVQTESN